MAGLCLSTFGTSFWLESPLPWTLVSKLGVQSEQVVKQRTEKRYKTNNCIKWSGQWYLHPLLECELPIVFLMLLHAFYIILSASKETGGVTLLPLQCLLLKSSNSFVLDPYSFHQDHLPYPLTLQQQ
jgi:hypothetical protein